MDVSWRIELFGGLRVTQGERSITRFETRKTAALLARLALSLGRAQPRELLTEQLWPDEDADATRDRFRHALAALRRLLEPAGLPSGSILIADRTDVQLNSRAVTTDVSEFEAALRSAAGRSAAAEERASHLCRAVEIYRGELLPGYYEDWILAERERLAEAHRNALSYAATAQAEAGDLRAAIGYARRAVAADPWREDAHCALMRLYAATGRTSEALRQYRDLERVLREELAITPSPATQALLAELRAHASAPAAVPAARTTPTGPAAGAGPAIALEPEGGAVPLDSPFYVVRPADGEFAAALARRDSIVLVKGARQMGKTSLLARGLQQAREAGAQVILTDLQKLTVDQMKSADTLFFTLAEAMADQLELEASLDTAWNPHRGWNVNFERFLRREVLGKSAPPIVWGLDEVDRLFGHPFSAEVFGLFRSWHNERALDPSGPWGRLTLAMAYATEAHLFITDLNQSPFNVGTRLTLQDFTPGEVAELNRRYQSPLQDAAEAARFYSLVGGNPYLVRRGLHALAAQGLDIAAFAAQAEQENGIFGDHLRRLLHALRQDPDLVDAVRAVLRGDGCPKEESFYRLRSAGVLAGTSAEDAQPRCRLYHSYLERHLL